MEMETRSARPEISLRTLFSRSSRRLLRSLNRSLIQHLHLVSSMFSSQSAGHTDTGLILSAVILQDLLMDGTFPALHGQGGVT
ncbi:hypothetical protein AB205_0197540 [Aquarana catesbeiana]|uniref:Uncharacterized protein n=1 Tax=Aquarana catesbeiana TaxID=8400 RepID=A0A2G9RDR3_AQUCT|nr:hypothetical protein AB205_0197540 [Aquarana catesbeiana]